MTSPLTVIDADTAEQLLDWPILIDALDQAHKKEPPLVDRSLLVNDRPGAAPDSFLVWPAWQPGRYFGIKMATSRPGNAEKGLAAVHSVYQLFSGETGAPLATVAADPLTLRKTAADSALGSRYLSRPDAETLLVIGAGPQAEAQVHAHLAVRPGIKQIVCWNRTQGKADDLARRLTNSADGRDVSMTDDLPSAVSGANIITAATGATTPLIEGDRLMPGTHLDLVGGYTPEMREADNRAAEKSRIFVDSRQFAIHQTGDIQGAIDAGVITIDDVEGDLYDLATGRATGRQTDEEITMFKNAGGGHLDLFTAICLWERFCEGSGGT